MVKLTTIGSDSVVMCVEQSALEEAEGGITLWVEQWLGTPLEQKTAYTLTSEEAREVASDIERVLSPPPS